MQQSKHTAQKGTLKGGTIKNFIKAQNKCPLFIGHTDQGVNILNFFDGIPFSILITIVTIITLFSDDIRQIAFLKESDEPFSYLTICCMTIYVVEMIALSLTKDGYFLKFYFWLDLISTLTMLLDLVWITQLINGSQGVQAAASVVKIARASRASKIGAKSTKLIRMLRLIRVLRLYKTASNRMAKENQQNIKAKNAVTNSKQLLTKIKMSDPTHQMRKNSKRIQRIQEAVSSSGIGGAHNNRVQRSQHQVSIKNIVFEGSNRKLSALHPSRNSLSIRHPSAMMKVGDSIPSAAKIPSNKQVQAVDKQKGHSNQHFVSAQQIQNMQTVHQVNESSQQLDFPTETKLGTKLNDQIQKNIISMILLILISIPLINGDTWFEQLTTYQKSIQELTYFSRNIPAFFDAESKIFIDSMSKLPLPLIYFEVAVNQTCCQFPRDYPEYGEVISLENLRTDQISLYLSSLNDTVIYNIKPSNILSAQLNIGRTLFVCILLIIVTLLFSRDLEIHALQPIQNMLQTVKRISSHPLEAMKHIQRQLMIKQSLEKHPQVQNNLSDDVLDLMEQQSQINKTEPAILENMIIKISSLLAVGFGEAGTDLIAKNIENCGKLNVMIPGKKIMGIFGFCDIRNFTDATEVLEAKVMVFVNQIAQICHKVVNRVGGNPNKNIGDAFLLVWKFQDDDTVSVQNRHETSLQLRSSLKVRQTADLAVFSFIKMVAEITRSQQLQKYRQNKKLKQRIPNYQGVKMGFGLHVGWAIQGPIGSQFKIDASYLGPHVNMSSRLEGATKEYGIPILITGDLYALMTPKVKQYLRQIDRVQVKAGEKPMDLYTVDISSEALLLAKGIYKTVEKTTFQRKKAKVYLSHERDILLEQIQKKRVTANIWRDDQDIAAMRQPYSKFFFEEWKKGFQLYQKGQWKEALQTLKTTQVLGLNNMDGPSTNLINYIIARNMVAPQNWNGARQFCG